MSGERGSAVVELVLLGVPLLVPLVWVAVALSVVHQAEAGVTEAARQAARGYATGTTGTAAARAEAAAGRALADRGLPPGTVRYAPAGTGCAAATPTAPPPRPGRPVAVCVTATVRVPLLPGPRSLTARAVAHPDPHRDLR